VRTFSFIGTKLELRNNSKRIRESTRRIFFFEFSACVLCNIIFHAVVTCGIVNPPALQYPCGPDACCCVLSYEPLFQIEILPAVVICYFLFITCEIVGNAREPILGFVAGESVTSSRCSRDTHFKYVETCYSHHIRQKTNRTRNILQIWYQRCGRIRLLASSAGSLWPQ